MAIINGTNGDDNFANSLFGTIQDDQIFGFAGNDFLFGSAGNDMLDGGADYDVALYAGGLFDATGVFINNTGSTVTALWNGVSTTALASPQIRRIIKTTS
jgi:Ca2+-binding RTX toxin-like protein